MENIIYKAQKLTTHDLSNEDFQWYSPGIRAQVFNTATKKLEMDFVTIDKDKEIHLLNSVSPAWTCSFATSKKIVSRILEKL